MIDEADISLDDPNDPLIEELKNAELQLQKLQKASGQAQSKPAEPK